MKKILLGLIGLFVLVIAGLAIFISQIDVTEYRDQALVEVEKATGRKVSIDGDLDIAFSLTPSIVVEGIRIANADWGSKPDMVSISSIEVQVALLPLLSSEIEIQRFVLIEPNVYLEKNAAGKGNWEIGESTQAESASDGGDMTAIDIGTVLIEKLKLVYIDPAAEKPTEFTIESLSLDTQDDDSLEMNLQAALDNNKIEVNGNIGSLPTLFDNNSYPVDLSASVGALSTTLKGVVNKPLDGKGLDLSMTAETGMLNELNSLVGSELPEIGPLSVATKLTDENNKYNLKELLLTLGDTSLKGNLSADISGKVPALTAKLQSDSVNLVPFQPEPPAETEKVERYLSDDPLPLDGLKAANADISLDIKEVLTRQAKLENFSTRLSLNQGNLSVKPLSMNLAGGKLSGNLKLDASGNMPALALNLDGKAINIGELEQLKDKLSGGPTDMTIRFSGRGNSSQAIAGGANGKLLVKVGQAQIKQEAKKGGFLSSIGELLNPFSKKDNSALDCAVINFNIKDGIAVANKGIGVETKQITVAGGGEINLKNEKLALGFEPNAKGAVAGTITNLASGMKAEGTLANPEIKINPAGVAMGAIKSVAGIAGGAGDMLGGLFGKDKDEKSAKDTAPCNTALTGKATLARTATKTTETKTTGTKTEEQPNKVESVTKEVLDAPKKLLKGLFD